VLRQQAAQQRRLGGGSGRHRRRCDAERVQKVVQQYAYRLATETDSRLDSSVRLTLRPRRFSARRIARVSSVATEPV
jgi:hypothetical protein